MMLEDYELGEIIARSARSVVRRAVRRRDRAPVVVKLHSSELPTAREVGQLEFEYRILQKLQHPSVVRAVDLVKTGERLALVLEDFGGVDLAALGGRPPLDLFFAIATGVARALQAVHHAGVIHKDVTPRNVLLHRETRTVKLIDFGIATELSQERQTIEAAGHMEGTLPYVSPEQTGRMNRDLDYRSDYYSLGATLFELLTGQLLFSAQDAMGWLHCHISRLPRSPSDIDPRIPTPVSEIVLKLLAKSPDDRYQSAHGIITDLEICGREWSLRGTVAPFPIGAADIPERFRVSQKLFGREAEVAVLRAAFDEASHGPAKLLLVGGYSGVGKSAVIQELQKDIVRGRGHFVSGKFDQVDRNLPYSAIVQAIRSLVKQLLGEPDESLARWRRELSAAVGSNGRALIDLVPELEEVLGSQPPVPALAPREAHMRFQRVFADFLLSAATPDHPLVLFVDDLQWADPSTPALLVHLLSDEALRNLLVIGAYRDNEVEPGHVLGDAIRELVEKRPAALLQIRIEPLSEDDVTRLVADTLHQATESCRSVSAIVVQKTGGNPFFVKELLAMLARDGVFRFVPDEGRWDWDQERIERASIGDNVVDLMVQRLRGLPAETTDVLRLAACLGGAFELTVLARLAGKGAGQVAAALWSAVCENVLVPVGSSYRLVHDGRAYDDATLDTLRVQYQFRHDRVQQAAYSLLDKRDRPHVHLAIGRLLRATLPEKNADELLFETVNHLNLGRSLVTDTAERHALSRVNERAGTRAKRASALAVAAAYFETSTDLLTMEERAADGARVFECDRNRIECLLYSGDPERAEQLCAALHERAPDRWSQILALELKAEVLEYQARLLEAIATLRDALRLVDVELPDDMEAIGLLIGEGVGKMQAHLARVPIDELVNLPEMTDRASITKGRLFSHLVQPSIQACPPLFILIELMMFDLALSAGTTELSCKDFVYWGIIQASVVGDYDRAYRLGKAAFELLKHEASRQFAPAVTFVFASFLSHWRAHYPESLAAYADAERIGLELGDSVHVAYAHALGTWRWFFVGRPLSVCHEKATRSAAYLARLRATNQLNAVRLVEYAIARLGGADPPSGGSDEEFTERMLEVGNAQTIFTHAHAHCFASVILRDYDAAARWDALAMQHEAGGTIQFSYPDHHALACLLLARAYGEAAPEDRAAIGARIDEKLARLSTWAKSCPENYATKHLLAAAAAASVRGAPLEEVLTLYDQAISVAGDDFLPWRGLANELLGELWVSRAQPKIARLFIVQASRLYERWGATVKVRQLQELHPAVVDARASNAVTSTTTSTGALTFARTDRSVSVDDGFLDLDSMFKATLAISREVKPERLFARLMATLLENAGAQRGCLVLRDESTGELHVEAYASTDDAPFEPRRHLPLAECTELSPDIVRYVARTGVPVVVDDAISDPAHREDAHVRRVGVRSLLCMPVLHQTKVVAVLYAENNAAPHAFTPQRLRLLQVIASQAAISITNARLYDNLEDRVQKRTRELAEKNREIAAMLNSMQQGVFTIDQTLTIQPQYSGHLEAILGTSEIAGRDFMPLLFRDSSVDDDALRAMRSALQFSFGVRTFIAEVNSEHLVRQFHRVGADGERREFEVDWTLIANDTGEVSKVLGAVRDVTALKRLTASVAQKARELDIVGQILDAGIDAFDRFCRATEMLLVESRSILAGPVPLGRADQAALARNMHTIKGNARMIGLSHVVEVTHRAEQAYLSGESDGEPPSRDALRAWLATIAEIVEDYKVVCKRKLGQLGAAGDARQSAALAEVGLLARSAGGGSLGAAEAVQRIAVVLSKASATSLHEVVRETSRMLPSLARELDKPPPEVDCVDPGLLLTSEGAQVVRDVLVHVFRNAIDHGIERPTERKAAGKSSQGRIVVRVLRRADGAGLGVSDDGLGLNLAALRVKVDDLASGDDDIADQVFTSGLSTAARVTTLSGRGVGMDAVRAFLRRVGGDARVVLMGESANGYRPFELVIDLPAAVLVGAAAAPNSVPPATPAAPRAQA